MIQQCIFTGRFCRGKGRHQHQTDLPPALGNSHGYSIAAAFGIGGAAHDFRVSAFGLCRAF